MPDIGQALPLLDQILSQLDYIKQQQQTYWKYVESRDNIVKKALMANFTRLYPSFPAFPLALFKSWSQVDPFAPQGSKSDTENDLEPLVRKSSAQENGKQPMGEESIPAATQQSTKIEEATMHSSST